MLIKKAVAILTSILISLSFLNLNSTKISATETTNGKYYYEYGGPVDLSIANEEKIIEMLKKEGKINKNATYEEAYNKYLEYMRNAAKENIKQKINKMDKQLKAKQNQAVKKYVFEKRKPDANPKKVNILVLLIEYQDYKHNSIMPEETDMYYKDYNKKHFEDLLFGDNGYTGPNGEKFISMKQYYLEQSGGSLIVDGKVAGWYTAPENAAYYGAENGTSHDISPRTLVEHALQQAALDPSINFADFDKEDRYDLDSDGNYDEPDGIIDHLMIIHAGIGQEAGGGSLGSDAIWSHRWNLGEPYQIPGTEYWAYDYTIQPEDGATGVFAHEFGHDLGLPDEYDTIYSSPVSEPISRWSIMSSGSWSGIILGTEPTGFSPYAKQFLQAVYGGNWQNVIDINYSELTKGGSEVVLRQASETGQVLRIVLPDKKHVVNTPYSGKYSYWGGKGSDGSPFKTWMTAKVDLTNKETAKLTFKTWYDIEEGWDFATVQVREVGSEEWTFLKGNITTTERDPNADVKVPFGITGSSEGKWVDAEFDLSDFVGKEIELKFEYETDSYVFGAGFYVDNISIIADNEQVLFDDVEGEPKFNLNGFIKDTGVIFAPHYYLVEWRNHHGVDKGLAHNNVLGNIFSYDPGMLVWYVDEYFTDNWYGVHPGDGFLGIVDADQNNIMWKFINGKKAFASATYQMHDAAFSKNKESSLYVDLVDYYGRYAEDDYRYSEHVFDDTKDYTNAQLPYLGRNIISYGLKIEIAQQAKDNSYAKIRIKR
ncbi:Metalloprotease, putative zinc-binding domain [Thermobrachium celere DSM 8682]|uniref:Metalloprotease, putative zinc-binding domain n=1 Tax=Thermobrachium celere DSM 8682 TaxID=941824 RepID=R7RSV1_9CLOT|nr:immune inhibitor A domain-containing protein [Thermobrachium celere]CDF59282.1 Metalloprotease, putative zinc-binding domain [Thermobrachium celere DSM 8682]